MSEIKVGDLVVIAYDACCDNPRPHLGKIFRVAKFKLDTGPCSYCGANGETNALSEGDEYGYRLRRLKRIPPLSELEGEKEKKEITA